MWMVMWCSMASAANAPQVVAQGFSADARYHLLLTALVLDGSGFPSAALQITDVTRNRIVYRQEHVWKSADSADLSTLIQNWRTSQAGVLRTYGLTAPVAGQRVFHVPPLPPLAYPAATPVNVGSVLGPFTLSSRPRPSSCPASDVPPRGFLLAFRGEVLQNDVRVPASRACARGYRLDTAWTYRTGLAVILRVYTPGFEGPDVTPLVVTGRLKK